MREKMPLMKKRKIMAWILTFLGVFGAIGLALGLLGFNANYNSIYSAPTDNGSVFDCSSFHYTEKSQVMINLSNETLFYHDVWAVTDNKEEAPNGIIDIKDGWLAKGYPKGSYGTYRWTIKGLNEDTRPKFRVGHISAVSTRFYVDDGSSASPFYLSGWGEMSRDKAIYPGLTPEKALKYFSPQSSSFDLYMEFSYSPLGTTGQPGISLFTFGSYGNNAVYASAGGTAVLLMVLLAIATLTSSNDRKTAWPFLLLSLSMALSYFATDFSTMIAPLIGLSTPFWVLILLDYLSILLIITSLVYFFYKQKEVKPRKSSTVFFFSSLALSAIFFACLFETHYFLLCIVPLLVYSFWLLWRVIADPKGDKKATIPLLVIFYTFILFIVFDAMANSNLIIFTTQGFPSLALSIMAIVASYFYFLITDNLRKKAEKAEENEMFYREAKAKSLVESVSPHFLFNGLTLVEGSYHASLKAGDESIDLLSKNLRASLEATTKPLIPLEEELDHISDYVDLSNLRKGSLIEVLFDLGYEDFKVPPLSLQVFVENSIKHGKLGEITGGHIIVKTSKDEKEITVNIIDNGCGFDPKGIDVTSHTGIHNASVRLEMSLHAVTEVKSSLNEGTTITIKIPLKEEETREK